jgi:hypothetical protein
LPRLLREEVGGLQGGIAGDFRGVKRNLAGGGCAFEGEAAAYF